MPATNAGVSVKTFRPLLLLALSLMMLMVFVTPPHVLATPQVHHWRHFVKGKELFDQKKYDAAAHELEHAVAQLKTNASYYMLLARAYERLEKYQLSANNYYIAAELYKKTDYNAYLVNKSRGDAWSTQIELYSFEAGQRPPANWKLAKHEPLQGVYIGAFTEYDAAIGPRNVQKFNQLTGKQHAMFFTYHDYGKPFPVNWANKVKEAGGAIQLAYEPRVGLAAVKDDAYLREFARACKAFGNPIFLRYAAEMNGSWTPWHGNPALYIQKFRLIAKVMREEAPNVAMVWAPNSNPENQIDRYYPGDEAVDWVGVNLYSVRFFNGDVTQSAEHVNPLDLMDYVYKRYAARKPIMIAEYGATHFSRAGNLNTTVFAINKMNMFYRGVKMKYPRVKSINWFSVNTLQRNENPERKLNNFSLTENSRVLDAYKQMIKDPYYLSTVKAGTNAITPTTRLSGMVPLLNRTVKINKIDGYAWIKTYDPNISSVRFSLNGKPLSTANQYPFPFSVDMSKLNKGKHKLTVQIFDSKRRLAATKDVFFFK